MTPHAEHASRTLVDDLRAVFAERLVSVVVYGRATAGPHGPLSAVALVSALDHQDLEVCAGLIHRWQRAEISTPLLLTEEEFLRSLDAFPLEYAAMAASHVRIFGRDCFDGIAIDRADIRRACERQSKSLLLHLREGYLEAHGQPAAIAALVAASTEPFASILRGAAQFLGVQGSSPGSVVLEAAQALGLSVDLVSRVLTLGERSTAAADGARLFPEYLAGVEQLTRAVDGWRP